MTPIEAKTVAELAKAGTQGEWKSDWNGAFFWIDPVIAEVHGTSKKSEANARRIANVPLYEASILQLHADLEAAKDALRKLGAG